MGDSSIISSHQSSSSHQEHSTNEASEKSPLISAAKKIKGKELLKSIGFLHAFVYVVSLLFGNGIFISPGLIASQTSNMGMALIVWALSGIPSMLGALCYVELACMLKKTGGRYLFCLEAFGDSVAFFTLWAQIFVTTPTAMAVLSYAIGEHFLQPFYDVHSIEGEWIIKSIATFCLTVTLVLNCVSTSFVNRTQVVISATQAIAVVFLIAIGIWKVSSGGTSQYQTMFNRTENFNAGKFGVAMYDGFWAYAAWGVVGCVTEELHNLERDLWLSVVCGFPFVIACYLLANLAFMSALTHQDIANSSTVATTFVAATLGGKVALIIPIAVGISCFGSLNGSLFIMSRVMLSAAREGQMPRHMSFIHKYKRTPIPAALFFYLASLLWVLVVGSGTETLITYYSFAMWLTHIPAVLAVIILRVKRPHAERPIKVWLINPLVTVLMATVLLILPFIQRPVESSICLVILLIAFPVYYIFLKKRVKLPATFSKVGQLLEDFMVERLNLVPCIFKVKDDSVEVVL